MSKLKITPLANRIIIVRSEAETKSAGGIVLPDSAKEKPQEGKVVAVGAGKILDSGERAKPEVKVGDRVVFNSYGFTEQTVDGQEVIIIEETHILAKLG